MRVLGCMAERSFQENVANAASAIATKIMPLLRKQHRRGGSLLLQRAETLSAPRITRRMFSPRIFLISSSL